MRATLRVLLVVVGLLHACSQSGGRDPRPTRVLTAGNNSAAAGRSGALEISRPAGSPAITLPPASALTRFHRDDTSRSGLSPDVIQRIRSGTGPCSANIAYPNEGTLFPGGLLPPMILWPVAPGEVQTGAYLRVAYEGDTNEVDYQYAVGGATPGQMRIPEDAWREITARTNDTQLQLELKIELGGAVQVCKTHWRIARGRITGSLYYYQSPANFVDSAAVSFNPIAPAAAQPGVFRLKLGAAASEPFIVQKDGGTACIGCHSMNARGTTVAALNGAVDLFLQIMISHDVFDVSSGSAVKTGRVDNAAYGALTPDGKFILTLGAPACTAGQFFDLPPSGNPLFLEGPSVAKLQDTASGAVVPAKGLNPDWYMWMPQFSPDGTKVVFNHAKPDPNRPGFVDRRELAVMDYDPTTHTFSNLKVILSRVGPDPSADYLATSVYNWSRYPSPGREGCSAAPEQIGSTVTATSEVCVEPCYPAWPAFTPDGKAVIFSLVDQPDFNHRYGRQIAAKAHLYYLELQSGRRVRLDNAMRVRDQAEFGYDNYPTVLPVSVGGYAWIFWTARRSIGPLGGGLFSTNPRDPAGDPGARRIWVSGVRLASGASTSADPSSPAFYLEGQGARPSMRAFAALNPCSEDGKACTSGVDCCTGFCTMGSCGKPTAPACSKIMDACKLDTDCCQSPVATACIGGFCDIITLQ